MILLEGRYNRVKKEHNLNLISREEYDRVLTQLANTIISVYDIDNNLEEENKIKIRIANAAIRENDYETSLSVLSTIKHNIYSKEINDLILQCEKHLRLDKLDLLFESQYASFYHGAFFILIFIKVENLNSQIAPILKSDMMLSFQSIEEKNLIIDCSCIRYADSSGLSALFAGYRTCKSENSEFILCGVHKSSQFAKLLEISRLPSVLDIRETLFESKLYLYHKGKINKRE